MQQPLGRLHMSAVDDQCVLVHRPHDAGGKVGRREHHVALPREPAAQQQCAARGTFLQNRANCGGASSVAHVHFRRASPPGYSLSDYGTILHLTLSGLSECTTPPRLRSSQLKPFENEDQY